MRKVVAILLIAVLVFPLLLALLATSAVSTWVLDRQFYEDILSNDKLYEAMLSEDLPIYVNRHVVSDVDQIAVGALSNALRVVVTPQYLRGEAVRMVDDVFDFIEGNDATLDIYLNLAPVKALVVGEKRQDFADALAGSLPACKANEEPKVPGGILARCIKSDQTVDEVAQEIYDNLPAYAAKYPDKLDLVSGPIRISDRWDWSRPVFSMAGKSGLALGIIILGFMAGGAWLIVAFIGGDNWKSRLHWLGWSLIVPAGLIFLIGIFTNSNIVGDWVRFGLAQANIDGHDYTIFFQNTLWEIIQPALDRISTGFLVAGGAAGAIALALIIWAFSMPSKLGLVGQGFPQPYAPLPPQPYAPPAPQPSAVPPVEPAVSPMQPMTPPEEPKAEEPPAETQQ